jgi:hypothetical protein
VTPEEDAVADPDKLAGALLSLVPVGVDEVDRLARDFQVEGLHSDAGLHKPPTAQSLREDLEDRELFICDMIPEESDDSVGYAGIVGYSGPPYLFVHYREGLSPDLDMAQEAFLLLAQAFFQHTNEERLWTYQPKPVPDAIHDALIEGGFDAWETTVPGIDNANTACYILERHTYDAYYNDEADEDEEAFEEY